MASAMINEDNLGFVPGIAKSEIIPYIFDLLNLGDGQSQHYGWGDNKINDPGAYFVHGNYFGGPGQSSSSSIVEEGNKNADFLVLTIKGTEPVMNPYDDSWILWTQIALSLTQHKPADDNGHMAHPIYTRIKYNTSAFWTSWVGVG